MFFPFRGVFSSISLIIGAACGIYLKVPTKVISIIMAFGAGALLFALSIEIYGIAICQFENGGHTDRIPMLLLAVGSVLGAIMFSVTNYLVETKGGVFRTIEWDNDWVSSVLGVCFPKFRRSESFHDPDDSTAPNIAVSDSTEPATSEDPLIRSSRYRSTMSGYGRECTPMHAGLRFSSC